MTRWFNIKLDQAVIWADGYYHNHDWFPKRPGKLICDYYEHRMAGWAFDEEPWTASTFIQHWKQP